MRRTAFLSFVLAAACAASLSAFAAAPQWNELEDGTRRATIEPPSPSWISAGGAFAPELAGWGRLRVSGAPDVPARRERFVHAPGASAEIVAVDVDWLEGRLPGAVAPYPARDPRRAPLDRAFAERGGFWPAEVARIVGEGSLRGVAYSEIEIAPLEVDVAAGTFRVARSIALTVRESGGATKTIAAEGAADHVLEAAAPFLAQTAETARRAPLAAAATAMSAAAAPTARSAAAPASAAASASAAAAPSYPAWQVEVTAEGLHRLTYAWIRDNLPGLEAQDPRRIRMTVQGVEIPIVVEGEADGTFDPTDAIVFYGQPLGDADLFGADVFEGGRYASANVYRIDLADAPPRTAPLAGAGSPSHGWPVPPSFPTTARLKPNEFFVGSLPRDGMEHWYAAPALVAGCSASCASPLPAARCGACDAGTSCCAGAASRAVPTPGAAGAPTAVRAHLLGFTTATNAHRVDLSVGGVAAGTLDWDGFDAATVSGSSAATLGATTTVAATLPLGRSGTTYDAAALDWFEIDYPRAYAAQGDALVFTAPNGPAELHVSGFGGAPRVWDVSATTLSAAGMAIAQPASVAADFVSGAARFEFAADAARPATRRFAAADGSGFLTPRAGRRDLPPSSLDASLGDSLKADGLGADWLVVGDRALLDLGASSQLSRLAALRADRARQGLKTAIVDLADVYDEFSFGVPDPQALRDFVSYALAHWSPAPSFLLLVGDATRDPRDYYGHAPAREHVPTHFADVSADTQFGYYPSDSWFGAPDGGPLPQLFVGRIPARTLAEAEGVFKKIADYEQGAAAAGSWTGKTLLVAEREEATFVDEADALYGRWFSGGPQTATKVYETVQDEDCAGSGGTMKSRLTAALSAGAGVVAFAGHGGYQEWGKGCTIFEAAAPGSGDDLEALPDGMPLGFQINANCITGHFPQDSPTSSSVDLWYTFLESWVTRGGKGAVAGIAPSHLSYSFLLDPILNPVFDALYGKRKTRLAGALDFAVRAELAAVNDPVAARSLIFQGDPATVLAVPNPPVPQGVAVERAGSGKVRVSWNAVDWSGRSGAPRYGVYRAAAAAGPYARVAETAGTSFDDAGLANCAPVYYYVVSVDAAGFESAWSNFNEDCDGGAGCRAIVPLNPDPPAKVLGVAATDTQQGGAVRVTWSAANQAADVVRYQVAWGPTAGGPYPSSAETAGAATEFVVGGLADDAAVHVVVRAETCSAVGPASDEASAVPHRVQGIAPPSPVRDLRVTKVAGTSDLRLDWTVDGLSVWGTTSTPAAVEVYGDPAAASFPLDAAHRLASLAGSARSWTDAGAAAGTAGRRYTVVVVDAAGLRSSGSDQAAAGIDTLRVAKGAGGVSLSWTTPTTGLDGRPIVVAGFELHGAAAPLSRAACGPANLVATLPATAVSAAEPLPAGATFFWQLLAVDPYGALSTW